MLDLDNIWMQPFKDKSKRNGIGFGAGSSRMISFEVGNQDLPVKGVVCS